MKSKGVRALELAVIFCALAWLGINIFIIGSILLHGHHPTWDVHLSFSSDWELEVAVGPPASLRTITFTLAHWISLVTALVVVGYGVTTFREGKK